MINRILSFVKKEVVLCAAILCAIVSSIFVRPTFHAVFSAIDWRVLSLLFCLMILIQGFKKINVLDKLASTVIGFCENTRSLFFALTFLVFFSSMVLTNDAALLTFVPLTLLICKKIKINPVRIIILETLAANLGSCITPMGNPQNLYLYSFYEMTPKTFFASTLKIGIPSVVFLVLACLWESRKNAVSAKSKIELTQTLAEPIQPVKTVVYSALLILVLLTVFRILDFKLMLAITVVAVIFTNYKLFTKVDYSLLFTFVGFFIFTSNISSIPSISAFLKSVQRTPLLSYITGIGVSQVISNVPAALLLSKFTTYPFELLLSVNVGGLGTLIASLASVISYKLYKADSENEGGYMKAFTIYNVLFLVILGVVVWIV